MNRALLIAGGVLIVLISFFLFLSSLLNKEVQQTNTTVTPIPTQQLNSSGGKQVFYPEVELEDHFDYNQDEKDKLDAFKLILPYFSSNLEIAYSDELDLFFIQKKTSQADSELNALLENAQLTQIFQDRSAQFIQTNESPSTAITNAKDTVLQIKNEVDGEEVAGKSKDTQQAKDAATLGDLSTVLFNFTVPTAPPPEQPAGKSPSGGTCATGGYPFADRNHAVVGRPGVGTHNGRPPYNNWQSSNAVDLAAPVGTPLCAIAAGTIGRIKIGDMRCSSRSAGISVYLDVGGRQWWYTHLSRIAPGISQGARVSAGQTIGYSGSANCVPHLHLGVSTGNPVSLLGL